MVGGAGMIAEMFIAACATLLWANTGPGTLHSLAYNVMFAASVSTILFNGNPLLRYDGYYMLSDLLDIPNLYPRAIQQLTHWAERYAFGFKRSKSPTRSTREALWLTVYGLASNVYRIVVFGGIIIFVTKRLLLLGIIMAFVCVISWVLYPVGKFIYYLATSPKLDRTRPRAIAVSACVAGSLLVFLGLIPFPHHFRAPGILQSQQYAVVANMEPGYVEEILAPTGSQVVAGQPLVRLKSQELEIDARLMHAQRRQAVVLWRQALQSGARELETIRRHLEAVEQRMQNLRERQESLTVRADRAGRWVAPQLKDQLGAWVGRGRPLGEIVNDDKFDFTITVSQEDASSLFSEQIRGAEIRIRGEADGVVRTDDWRVIPVQRQNLPSPALGYQAGGSVAVDMTDKSGTRAAEPFFEVRASLPSGQATTFLHGRSGKIRFKLRSEPLLSQWMRRLRQLIQKRSYA
jgi:putative peptide zinc metalloprotease protein